MALFKFQKLLRTIYDGLPLHPKNRTGFIVHFQPVLFDTMFNPCPGNSCARARVLHVRNDLAAEITGQFFSKEAHDILGAKAKGAMAQQT